VLDTYRFTNVQLTGLGTDASSQGSTLNDLSFVFDSFGQRYGVSGPTVEFALTGKSPAGAPQAPSPSDLSASHLGDGLELAQSLQYYVRFEGNGIQQGWLELDAFSMGMTRAASSSSAGGTKTGKATLEDTVLVLGSARQVVELTKAMVQGDVLKLVEIEAYGQSNDGERVLVDEFRFENVQVTGVKNSGAAHDTTTNHGFEETLSHEVTLGLAKFSHGHIELDAFGNSGNSSDVGYDFGTGTTKAGPFNAPSPDADLFP